MGKNTAEKMARKTEVGKGSLWDNAGSKDILSPLTYKLKCIKKIC